MADDVYPMSTVGTHDRALVVTYWSSHPLAMEYAKVAAIDALNRGESPISPVALLGGLFDLEELRDDGLAVALEWIDVVHRVVVYTDLGIDQEGELFIQLAHARGVEVVMRSIHDDDSEGGH